MAKKPKQPPSLPPFQLEIMNVVWERGEVTVGEVLEILSARRPRARNTVQTTMVRLEEKGWLRHRVVANAFRYSAAVEQKPTLGQIVREVIDNAFAGSVESLVLALVQERGITRDEARRIRKLIDESEKKGE